MSHPRISALLTDYYSLTMAQGYDALGRGQQRAVFEYVFRSLPPDTGYAVFAGLDPLLDDFQSLCFAEEDFAYLKQLPGMIPAFLEGLKTWSFTGHVWAAPEGTVVFPYEPVLRVEATLPDAQLIEGLVLNRLNYQTLVATKAARVCEAAQGDPVLEFGFRRAHGPDGALSGSRAAYIGGCIATSYMAAGLRYGIPVRGTMAHSWVMSFASELDAFRAYVSVSRDNPILLVDTYSTRHSGIPNAVTVFQELRTQGWTGRPAIRLDSGDLKQLAEYARERFLAARLPAPLIVASGDLDEDSILRLKKQHAPIEGWGVGTKLITGDPQPYWTGVYKLAAVQEAGGWRPRIKSSDTPEKTTEPGVKEVIRWSDHAGRPAGDVICLADELASSQTPATRACHRTDRTTQRVFDGMAGMPLTKPVMRDGTRLYPPIPLADVQRQVRANLDRLDPALRRLTSPSSYWVGLSERLSQLKVEMLRRSSDE
ncbi:MAG: nicotinate phosphoribosyltransferase [Candidatus Latescibacteria bacterium]|nr:nicotinate phosphoribosyltransferase [Candidatus Latescibacterota bacterium]